MRNLMVLLTASGCVPGYIGFAPDDDGECVTVERPAWGPTPADESEVVSQLSGWRPFVVKWDFSQVDPAATPSAVSMTVARGAEDAGIVKRRDGGSPESPFGCRPGPELRVPFEIAVDVDGGGATATLQGSVDAESEEPEPIYLSYLRGPAALTGQWKTLAEEEMGYAGEPDFYLLLTGSLAEPRLELIGEMRSASQQRRAVLWRGTVYEEVAPRAL